MDGSSAPTESWLGRPCPKCAYVRALSDTNPEWQCPRCHTAYAKWVTRPAAVQGLARHGREMAHEAGADTSLFFLLAANVLTLLVAVYTRMSLTDLMIAYWIQSVMIGVSYVVRILSRYLLGPDTVGTINVRVLVDESITPQDTAPRPVELDPDSAAVRSAEDSIRRVAEPE